LQNPAIQALETVASQYLELCTDQQDVNAGIDRMPTSLGLATDTPVTVDLNDVNEVCGLCFTHIQ